MTEDYETQKRQIELKILLRCSEIGKLDTKLANKTNPLSYDVRNAVEAEQTLYYEQVSDLFHEYEKVILLSAFR